MSTSSQIPARRLNTASNTGVRRIPGPDRSMMTATRRNFTGKILWLGETLLSGGDAFFETKACSTASPPVVGLRKPRGQ